MTPLLETAIQQLKALPSHRQNDLGMILLALAENETPIKTITFQEAKSIPTKAAKKRLNQATL